MKITIWLRCDSEGRRRVRLDYKYESNDDPQVQRYGRKLMDAIEGNEEPNTVTKTEN